MKKYVVVPGFVTSISDYEQHYITAAQLIRLYGVDAKDCIILSSKEMQAVFRIQPGQIILKPLISGQYTKLKN